MTLRTKIIITAVLIAVLGMGTYLVFRMTRKPKPEPASVPTLLPIASSATSSPSAEKANLSVRKISDNTVFDFWIGASGDVYYFTRDGLVFGAKDDTDVTVSKQALGTLTSMEPGPQNEQALIAFLQRDALQWALFDSIDQVVRPLPQGILQAVWGKTEDELVALVKDGDIASLVSINLAKNPSEFRTLVRDFKMKDTLFQFVSPNRVFITERPSAAYRGSVWEFDMEKRALTLVHTPTPGLMVSRRQRASPFFLFAAPGQFSIVNERFAEVAPVVFTTLPQKCGGGRSVVACFVPQEIPSRGALPDDYLKRKFYSLDNLFLTDTISLETRKVFSSEKEGIPPIDGIHPVFAEGKVYFINRYDSALYEAVIPR